MTEAYRPLSRREVKERIAECERTGEFDKHVDPPDYSLAIRVDKDFHYIKTTGERVKMFFQRLFIVNPFTFYHTRKEMRLKVTGKKNLKNIKGAVITLNHVDMFDCLAARRALKGHKLVITAADFNNRSDFLGEMMRAGGLMPFGSDFSAMRNFNSAIKEHLKKGYVLFYPEQALWWHYRKPRPYKDGAFHYAAKLNVPVIPMFITFTERGETDGEGLKKENFTLHIMPAVYPDPALNLSDNTQALKSAAQAACMSVYAETYSEKALKGDV